MLQDCVSVRIRGVFGLHIEGEVKAFIHEIGTFLAILDDDVNSKARLLYDVEFVLDLVTDHCVFDCQTLAVLVLGHGGALGFLGICGRSNLGG